MVGWGVLDTLPRPLRLNVTSLCSVDFRVSVDLEPEVVVAITTTTICHRQCTTSRGMLLPPLHQLRFRTEIHSDWPGHSRGHSCIHRTSSSLKCLESSSVQNPDGLRQFRIGILRFLFCSPSPPSSPASSGRPGRLRAARLAPGGPAGGPGPASGGRAGEIGRNTPPFLVHAYVFLVHA